MADVLLVQINKSYIRYDIAGKIQRDAGTLTPIGNTRCAFLKKRPATLSYWPKNFIFFLCSLDG